MSKVTELLDIHPGNLCFTFEPSKPMHCLIHLTNKSVDQRVAFRCQASRESEALFHDLADFVGILPPDSTSTFLVRLKSRQQLPLKKDVPHLTLESCVAAEEDKEDVGTIFGTRNQQIEGVKLKVTVREDEVDTIFNKAGEGTKELTLTAPVINSTLLEWVSETKMVLPMTEPSIDQGDLLDVHVLYQLISLDKNDKMINCILQLTSRTKHDVAFKCVPSNSHSCLYSLDHIKGILPSGSTNNFVLLTKKMKYLPDNRDALSIVLKTRVSVKEMDSNEDISSQDPRHEIPLMAIYDNKVRFLVSSLIFSELAATTKLN
ncbi:uncharacterized protein LOC119284292 [Triticum dicoccoides]|uniref:uncharacterized protein LOC119284292 n=1 Tax=Triticum dicoccoides TaxID=85692 RepID=UPI00189005B8|nr:uncharacterized protein LOC119284292 [Triticum dicoccoides]